MKAGPLVVAAGSRLVAASPGPARVVASVPQDAGEQAEQAPDLAGCERDQATGEESQAFHPQAEPVSCPIKFEEPLNLVGLIQVGGSASQCAR